MIPGYCADKPSSWKFVKRSNRRNSSIPSSGCWFRRSFEISEGKEERRKSLYCTLSVQPNPWGIPGVAAELGDRRIYEQSKAIQSTPRTPKHVLFRQWKNFRWGSKTSEDHYGWRETTRLPSALWDQVEVQIEQSALVGRAVWTTERPGQANVTQRNWLRYADMCWATRCPTWLWSGSQQSPLSYVEDDPQLLLKASLKKIQAWTGFEPVTSALFSQLLKLCV